jgi:hypothetical protein
MATKTEDKQLITITPIDLRTAIFRVTGTAPLVIHRMSLKTKLILQDRIGKPKGYKTPSHLLVPDTVEELFSQARYINAKKEKGEKKAVAWDGMQASAVRRSMVDVCRTAGVQMTLAKLAVKAIADGYDHLEPQFGIIRILDTEATQQVDIVPNIKGAAAAVRAAYHGWSMDVTLRWDNGMLRLDDLANLLHRVGEQVGWGCGRPFSSASCGMGWGTFVLEGSKELK